MGFLTMKIKFVADTVLSFLDFDYNLLRPGVLKRKNVPTDVIENPDNLRIEITGPSWYVVISWRAVSGKYGRLVLSKPKGIGF